MQSEILNKGIPPSDLNAQPSTGVDIHPWPYPYQAALAICSDLDETPDSETYFELMRFLNTTEDTSMGTGVGLEVGNSIYFDMSPGQFSYWNANEETREKIRTLIRSGHIDCLHSYGDLATTRSHAGRALEELARHDCYLKVWVDHSKAPTNFGADIMLGHGDEPGHPAYHADLTMGYGIRYVWRGRVTSIIGQNRPASLSGIADSGHPFASARTILKERSKQILARCGSTKYQMHANNRLMRRIRLRDGRDSALEFLRCNPHWGGVSCADRGDRIHEVLTPAFLNHLVERGGTCILYTHLGKLVRGRRFELPAIAAFRLLAEYYAARKILVMSTKRMLEHLSGERPKTLESWSRLQFPELSEN